MLEGGEGVLEDTLGGGESVRGCIERRIRVSIERVCIERVCSERVCQ